MALIKLNRTKTGAVPSALADGELYIDQLNGKLYWADASGRVQSTSLRDVFASGTVMLFRQATAPLGWSKVTSYDNAALRVVSGNISSGGTVAFSAAFGASASAGSTVLTVDQLPAHTHTVNDPGHSHTPNNGGSFVTTNGTAFGGDGNSKKSENTTANSPTGITLANTGAGAGHTHSLPMAGLKYVDVIFATKD